MTRQMVVAAFLVGAMAMAGCKDKYEKAVVKGIDVMKELAGVLEGIKDTETARKANPELKKVAERLKALEKEMKDIGEFPEDRERQLKARYKGETERLGKKMIDEMERISSLGPAVTTEIRSALGDISKGIPK
jgi:hypothetical protein